MTENLDLVSVRCARLRAQVDRLDQTAENICRFDLGVLGVECRREVSDLCSIDISNSGVQRDRLFFRKVRKRGFELRLLCFKD